MSTFDMNNATDVALKIGCLRYIVFTHHVYHHKLPKRLEYGYEIIGKKKKSS